MERSKWFFSVILSTLLSTMVGNQLRAQEFEESNFRLYCKEQGLSNNIVTSLAQDSIGYVWIATASGLNRFNGSNFVQYHSSNDTQSLPAEFVRNLVWLDKHKLMASAGGLHIIDTRTDESSNLFIPYADKQYQFKFNGVKAVTANAAGDIFVLTISGFYHFDKNKKLKFRFDYYPAEATSTEPFAFGRKILWLNPQQLAIVSISGIFVYNIDKMQFKKMEAADNADMGPYLNYPVTDFQFFQPNSNGLVVMNSYTDSLIYINLSQHTRTVTQLPFYPLRNEFDYRSDIMPINDTLFYITGSTSGFYKMIFYPETGKIGFYPKKYFPLYYIRQVMEDKDHNYWIATNNGVFKQDNSRPFVNKITLPASLLATYPNISIEDISEAGDKLYVAGRGNAGILVFNKQNLQFIKRIVFNRNKSDANNCYAIVSANENNLVIATNGPLINLDTRTDKISEIPLDNTLDKWHRNNNWISDVYKDRSNNIWIANGNIYKYNAATGKPILITTELKPFDKIQDINSIKEDAAGNIWIGGQGLIRYNTRLNIFDQLVDSFPSIKIPDRRINSFVADNENNLWINTNNNGLLRYDIDRKTFLHFTRDNGLPDNNISAMIIIGNKLWMATFSGIACMDIHNYRISSFGKEDGFPDQPTINSAKFFYNISANKLYAGFTNTLVQFDPNIIFQSKQVPHLFIERIQSGNQTKFTYPGNSITLSPQLTELSVTIGSINFSSGNSQQFAYKLLKDDSSQWQQLGTQGYFNISNLEPGRHRLQVKLSSIGNRWPDQVKELNVFILPPYWKQVWFMPLTLLFSLAAIFLLLKWRTSNIRKKERAKTHIQELKAEEYKNQFELEQISNYFSSSLAGKNNVEEVLWDVSQNLIGRMNYVDCIIYLWNRDKTKMVQKAAYGPKGNPHVIATQSFDVLPGQGVVGHVMKSKEPILVSDTSIDPRYRMDDMQRFSELCVPILHNNELIGIIDSEHPEKNHFRERDIKILTTIATLVGNKIIQIESEESLEKKQKELAYINQQLAEAQLSALQTQMNPHFIFNSLNSIKGMILDNQQQMASRYLSRFANMIRITLNQSKSTFTTLYENIEHLENYLSMEKLRFDDSFCFKITVDEQIDKEEVLIPTLMIQPLAENAIWHGLMHKKGDKKLVIHFSKMDDNISCIIEDNGIGINRSMLLHKISKTTHQSVGLNNLRNRIKIMNEKFNTGCSLEITDLQDINPKDCGTRVILCFNTIINQPLP